MFRIKYSREIILKLLCAMESLGLQEIDGDELLDDNMVFFKSLNPSERRFIVRTVDKVIEEKEGIDTLIRNSLIGWKLERLMLVDRNLLRMGIAESFFNDQKPVIIDDVVRIAKKYGSEESYKIINAILDKVIQ